MNRNILLNRYYNNLKIYENIKINTKLKICIIMSSNEEPNIKAAINYEYCKKYNYNFIYYNFNEPAYSILLTFLLNYEYLIYINNNFIFSDFNKPIHEYINTNVNITLLNNRSDNFIICKNSIKSIQFIKDWYNLKKIDENCIDKYIDYNIHSNIDSNIDSNINSNINFYIDSIKNITCSESTIRNYDTINYLLTKKYIHEYFSIKNPTNGQVISRLFMDFYNSKKYNNNLNILFVRTSTTGQWLDNINFSENEKYVTRILYDTKKYKDYTYHESTLIIESDDLEKYIIKINKKYDLICLDPFHEYNESFRDLNLLIPFLKDDGILFCHDCYSSKNVSLPKYDVGFWSGVTYIAFIEFAYNNPELYYSILNIDTGIGIISKIKYELLENKLDRQKQKKFLELSFHDYLTENSKDIINMIHMDDL